MKPSSGTLFIVTTLTILLCGVPDPGFGQPVTIVTEEWAPYNFTEDGVLKGFSTEVVRALLQELSRNDPIESFPGDRGMAMLRSEPRTMMFTVLRTREREKEFKWIGPLAETAIYFYQKKDDPLVIQNIDQARKVGLIACRSQGLVVTKLRTDGFANLDATATDGRQVYLKLLSGRCDLAISDSPLGVAYLLYQMGYPADSLVQTTVRLVADEGYIACSTDFADKEIALWQRTLDKVKVSVAFNKISQKYRVRRLPETAATTDSTTSKGDQ